MCASDSHSISLLILRKCDAIRRELLEISNFFFLFRLINRKYNKGMNKIFRLPLILITLLTLGCRHIEEIPDEEGVKKVSFGIYADYGQHVEKRVTLLLGDSIIPFSKDKFNIDTLLVGDYVTVSYTGELYINKTYPARWYMNGLTIKNVEVVHGTVHEYEMLPDPGGDSCSPASVGGESFDFGTKYVINEDGSFTEGLYDYPMHTKLYGIHPSHFASKTILAFYSYNPLIEP